MRRIFLTKCENTKCQTWKIRKDDCMTRHHATNNLWWILKNRIKRKNKHSVYSHLNKHHRLPIIHVPSIDTALISFSVQDYVQDLMLLKYSDRDCTALSSPRHTFMYNFLIFQTSVLFTSRVYHLQQEVFCSHRN